MPSFIPYLFAAGTVILAYGGESSDPSRWPLLMILAALYYIAGQLAEIKERL